MKRWVLLAVMVVLMIAALVVIQMGKLNLRDRSITYIVMGVLLLAVSFLYKRERRRRHL